MSTNYCTKQAMEYILNNFQEYFKTYAEKVLLNPLYALFKIGLYLLESQYFQV